MKLSSIIERNQFYHSCLQNVPHLGYTCGVSIQHPPYEFGLILRRGVNVTESDLAAIAAKVGYELKGNEKTEFTTLLAATCNSMQFVAEMDG